MSTLANYHKKHEGSGTNNERVCVISGITCILIFGALNFYSLYVGSKNIENLSVMTIDVEQVVFALLGIALIIIGILLPKTKMNSVTGLRTRWSMKNETTWKKSQSFGGITFVAAGFIMVIISLITKGITCMVLSLIVFSTAIIIDILYTYWISKKVKE